MVWSWGVQAESPKSGRDYGRNASTTEQDITIRKLEHVSPHSRGVILEGWDHGGVMGGRRRNLQKVAETVAGAHQLLSMTSRSGSWNMQVPIAGA